MAKMTTARADRWVKDVSKALALLERVHDDLGDAKLATIDTDNYSDVIDAGGHLVPAIRNLQGLVDVDVARSPIARIRARIIRAAEERKRVKAERDAKKQVATA